MTTSTTYRLDYLTTNLDGILQQSTFDQKQRALLSALLRIPALSTLTTTTSSCTITPQKEQEGMSNTEPRNMGPAREKTSPAGPADRPHLGSSKSWADVEEAAEFLIGIGAISTGSVVLVETPYGMVRVTGAYARKNTDAAGEAFTALVLTTEGY